MEWKIDNNMPIYIQVIDCIRQDIAKGVYMPGTRMVSSREFAIKSKINPNAVQRAMNQLVNENVLVRGMDGQLYVNNDAAANSQVKQMLVERRIKEFVDSMHEIGINDTEITGYVASYISR